MYDGYRVAAVVPAHNEAAHIAGVVARMPAYVDAIIVVDDGSSDGTAQAAARVGDPRVQTLQHAAPLGVGGATVAGARRALAIGAELIVKVDGDGQMDLERMDALLQPLAGDAYDYAKGNRFLHTSELRQMPASRLLGNLALTFLTKLASGYWQIFDPQNGFVAVKADTLRALDLDGLAQGFFFENDMLIHLNILNCRVIDVPIPAHYGTERSSLRVHSVLATFPPLLLRGFFRRIWQKYMLRDFSPIAIFWLLGVGLMLFGGLFGLLTWGHSLWSGVAASTGTVMLSVLPFLIGFELVLQAIILEIRESPR
jgi:dolichol-phosphate mannosyltransferase